MDTEGREYVSGEKSAVNFVKAPRGQKVGNKHSVPPFVV